MSQKWVTDILLEKLSTEHYDFALVNFAGPDMVGHSGSFEATKKSMEVLDECLGRIIAKVLELNGTVIITADHGNAEEMVNPATKKVDTNHSTNPVPCIVVNKELHAAELAVGSLADLAPTVLGLLGISSPAEMTGRNLLANYQ
jgi:2,3-bisphosphoglycerate-independent phosphoglycerate mutase